MCGIAGKFDTKQSRPIDGDLLRRMTRTLNHRGPDGEGYYEEPGVGLGHRRLSIIDLEGGRQPLFNEDGSVAVTYNGEIYNFRPLQIELERLGHRFHTRCDTEVIVHAWEEWGEDCVDRFNGMFAFAVYDRNRNSLFLARDRIGIKPLYYSFTSDGFLVFGSELKAVLVDPTVRRKIRIDSIDDYFALGYVPDPKTILEGVHKLAPGFTLLVQRGRSAPEQRRYWDVPYGAAVYSKSEDEAAVEFMERLSDSVTGQMISEVPLGAFLSGGVDSSAVAASMALSSSSPVTTCSISFGDPKFNESMFADKVAGMFKTSHHSEQVAPDDYSLLPKLRGFYDEPFADSSSIPTFRVCELARKHVTVALSGDGGDENLAGYRRYRWFDFEERFRSVIPSGLRNPLFGFLGRFYPKANWAPRMFRAKATLQAIAYDSVEGYFRGVSILDDEHRAAIFSDEFGRKLGGYRAMSVFEEHARHFTGDDNLSLVQYLDFKTYLPGDILTKVDRASMANSLEVRVPLLDHELVEWIASLSPDLKLRGGEGKYIFKKALRPTLPDDILYRAKMGFAVPLASWFRGPLKDESRRSILSEEMLDCGVFRQEKLRSVLDQHAAGTQDFSPLIWALLMFSEYLRAEGLDH